MTSAEVTEGEVTAVGAEVVEMKIEVSRPLKLCVA